MSPLLVADSIGRSFGRRRVLATARLAAEAGTVTALLGRNGAGKSTLLRIVSGRLAPDHGTIRYDGRLQGRARLSSLARAGLLYLPDRDVFSPRMPLRRQLQAFRFRFGGGSVEEAANRLAVASLLDRLPSTFSPAQRALAALVLALVRAPRCLIADEPLRGLDPKDALRATGCLRSLAERGCAVVASGQEAEVLLDAADRVVSVTAGTTYALGAPAAARRDARFRREYLTGRWT